MRGKTLILLMLSMVVFQMEVFSQQPTVNNSKCSEVMASVSYFWKKDSLTNNGYRWAVYRRFLNCTLDSVHVNYLLSTLGKPTRIDKYANSNIYYRYYYYDYKKMGEGFDGPYGYDMISFAINAKDSLVVEITRGSGEY